MLGSESARFNPNSKSPGHHNHRLPTRRAIIAGNSVEGMTRSLDQFTVVLVVEDNFVPRFQIREKAGLTHGIRGG
jgi:hypothetical protein